MVFFSKKAYKKIQRYVNDKYEVGGILLGSCRLCFWRVKAITCAVPDSKSNYKFTLDSNEHKVQIKLLEKRGVYPLGIWHSHISDMNEFSSQDKIANEQMVRLNGKILSVIVNQNSGDIKISPYLVFADKNGKIVTKKQKCFSKSKQVV